MAHRAAQKLLGTAFHSLKGPNGTGAAVLCSCGYGLAAFSSSSARLIATSSSSSAGSSKGRTPGELGHDAADSMGSKGQAAGHSQTAAKVEDRASSGGFVPAPDATPSPEAAGQFGGPGTAAMADMVDMVGGAFAGDDRRVERAAEDLTHDHAGVPPTAKPSHTTSQDWPRAGLQPEGAQPHTDAAEMEVNKYEGSVPRSSPPEAPPGIDQSPPENTTAGPTPDYNARGDSVRGRDNRPI